MGEGASRGAIEGREARLELERRALPQKALVRDLAIGLHAGTEGRQQRRRLRWMAPGMARGWPGSEVTRAMPRWLGCVAGLSQGTSCS